MRYTIGKDGKCTFSAKKGNKRLVGQAKSFEAAWEKCCEFWRSK